MNEQKPMVVESIKLIDIFLDSDFNSRGKFAPTDVVDLVKDIEKNGLIQPIVVMATPESDKPRTDKPYKVLAGFRRTYAHMVLLRETIPAVIHSPLSEIDSCVYNLSENLARLDLNILQEARAIQKLSRYALNETDIGNRLGKSRGWVQVRLMLLNLPDSIQHEVEMGNVGQVQIRELYTIYNKFGLEACIEATKKIKVAKATGRKGIIVDPAKLDQGAKRYRTRGEIITMLENVFDHIGPGIHTRLMAWCGGEISNTEIFTDLEDECAKIKKVYTRPIF